MENGRGISGLWVIVVLSLSPHVEHAFTTPTSQLGRGHRVRRQRCIHTAGRRRLHCICYAHQLDKSPVSTASYVSD